MAAASLPKVNELPRAAYSAVMLGSIGAMLRKRYDVLLLEPVPERLGTLVRQLP